MPKRIVMESIRLARGTTEKTYMAGSEQKTRTVANIVTPEIGKPFDFTTAEVDYLNEHRPSAIRRPISEGKTPEATTEEVQVNTKSAADENGNKAADAAAGL